MFAVVKQVPFDEDALYFYLKIFIRQVGQSCYSDSETVTDSSLNLLIYIQDP